jgi:hypothetical protein
LALSPQGAKTLEAVSHPEGGGVRINPAFADGVTIIASVAKRAMIAKAKKTIRG